MLNNTEEGFYSFSSQESRELSEDDQQKLAKQVNARFLITKTNIAILRQMSMISNEISLKSKHRKIGISFIIETKTISSKIEVGVPEI